MCKASFTRERAIWLNIMHQFKEMHYYEVECLGVYSIFWKKQMMVVCAICLPYEWNICTKPETIWLLLFCYFEEVKSFLETQMPCINNKEGGWASLKDILHLSNIVIFLQQYCFLLKGLPCLQCNYFEEVKPFLTKCRIREEGCTWVEKNIASFHTS